MFGFGMGWTDSLPPVRLHEDVFEHVHLPEDVRERKAAYILSQETVELMTVGIDIGSSTSHLLFAKIHLERERQRSSSRFVVVHRDIVWRSPKTVSSTPSGWLDSSNNRMPMPESSGKTSTAARSSSPVKRSKGETHKRSTSSSPMKRGNSSVRPPGTGSKRRSRRTARERSASRASAKAPSCMSTSAAGRRSSH